MNKKKVSLIVVGVLVLLLAIYLAFNPTWITHPKYMLDKQYCEQDSDCRFDFYDASAVNFYNLKIGAEFDRNYKSTKVFCNVNTCEVEQ